MKARISTSNGISKLIYQGMVLEYLDEQALESLRADIWIALQEIDLAKEMAKEYESLAVS